MYQIYPRSFTDSDGDGIGDLLGIAGRAEYLQQLGVDAVWLSPFYPSGWADGGYDIVDHRDVDRRLGSLPDFDVMLGRLHEVGIRVIVDIVPNHTSSGHPDFVSAVSDPESPQRAKYIFRPGRGIGGELPPNDWPSHFGPSCWARAPDGEWYLHLFAPEQPDLNWDNEDVRRDFDGILTFWADRGVDGFRVDVAHGLAKDLTEPWPEITSFDPELTPTDGSHPLFDRDELLDIYRRWRTVLRRYDRSLMMVAEAAVPAERLHRYVGDDAHDQAFNFDLLTTEWSAADFRASVDRELTNAAGAGASTTWVLGNHDCVRPVSRYGLPRGTDLNAWLLSSGKDPSVDLVLGTARARAAVMMLMALPGSTYVYQGEELGLPEVADLDPSVIEDPMWKRSGGTVRGRDGCRVPLPWTPDGPGLGFSPVAPALPQPPEFAALSVQSQESDPESTLTFYRRLIRVRAALRLSDAPIRWIDRGRDVLAFRRGDNWECLLNMGRDSAALPPGRVVLSSGPEPTDTLPANTCAWLSREE